MNKSWQVVLAFVVVFIAGGAIGSVFTLRYVQKRAMPVPTVPNSDVPYRAPESIAPQLMRRWLLNTTKNGGYQLTAQQREKIRLICFDTAEDIQRLQVESGNSSRLLIENMQDQIAAVLNPTQRDRYYQQIQSQRDQINNALKQYQQRVKQRQRAAEEAQQSAK